MQVLGLLLLGLCTAWAGNPQVITFPPITDHLTTDAPFPLAATSSSGLPVSYSIVSPPGVASISGGVMTLTGTPGSVTVKASLAASGTYDAAAEVRRSFAVGEGSRRLMTLWTGSSAASAAGIAADGTLWTWGANSNGQLGDGTTTSRRSPVQIGVAANWTHVTFGEAHAAALRSDGSLWTWGANAYGQLGNGMTNAVTVPAQMDGETTWSAVACGRHHTAALRSDGTLWIWGYNSQGQVGDGSTTDRKTPVQIGAGVAWAAVACGEEHTLALRGDGTLWAWGYNIYGQLGDGSTTRRTSPNQVGTGSTWTSIACGSGFAIARRADGTLWSWGNNGFGQLGDGSTFHRSSPVRVAGAGTWAAIHCGGSHVAARQSDGSLWTWGHNGSGQLGDGTTTNRTQPGLVRTTLTLPGVACGGDFTLGLQAEGMLWSWGSNQSGQLGNGSEDMRRVVPAQVATVASHTKLAAGPFHQAALRADGTLWMWGQNASGQLGDGTTQRQDLPVQVGSSARWSELALGTAHTAAIRADGTLWTWGSNSHGQLGDGTVSATFRTTPGPVGTANDWVSVGCMGNQTIAVRADGTLWTWGSYIIYDISYTTYTRTLPFRMDASTDWKSVNSSSSHTLALRRDGSLWGIGSNSFDALAPAYGTYYTVPVHLGTAADWASVACGSGCSFGIRSDGTLWAWGQNTSGKLGDGTITTRSDPVQIGTATNWVSIVCGKDHTLGLRADGTLWTWGSDLTGTINATDRYRPSQVGISTDWAAIAAREAYSLALRRDGTLWVWGQGGATRVGQNQMVPCRSWPSSSPQTVSWSLPPPSSLTPGQSTTLAATAGSGLPVAFTVRGPATLDGAVLTATGPGTVFVGAYQTGDGAWQNAEASMQTVQVPAPSLEVRGNGRVITAGDVTPSYADDTDFGPVSLAGVVDLRYFLLANTSTSDLTLGTTHLGGAQAADFTVAAVPGTVIPAGGVVPIEVAFSPTGEGLRQATLSFTTSIGGPPYQFAIQGTGFKEEQTLVFPPLAGRFNTDAPFALGATASSGLPVTYSIVSAPGIATVAGNVLSLTGATGAVTVKASQAGNGVVAAGQDMRSFMVLADTQRLVKVAAGPDCTHSAGIRADGTLWAWGENDNGQAGLGTTWISPAPVTQVGTATNWTDVACGGQQSAAVRADGTLWEWGRGVTAPVQVGTDTNWTAVACGGTAYKLALRSNGTLWAWGTNTNGQLGDGTQTHRAAPVQVGVATNWTAIACGSAHSAALRSDGTLWTWGDNWEGQLGHGTMRNSPYTTANSPHVVPLQVGTATGWTQVRCGVGHTVALRADGTLWTWGLNSSGQLGDDTTTSRTVPVQVGTASHWASADAGSTCTLAVATNGTLWSWGSSLYEGQLGYEAPTLQKTPRQVGADTTWSAVSCGNSHALALRQGGSLWAWGNNARGQVGHASSSVAVARQLQPGTFWTASASLWRHQLAVRGDGTLWGWGYGTNSEILNDGRYQYSAPIQIGRHRHWAAVAVGSQHSMALSDDGQLWGWGSNHSYQTGSYTQGDIPSPALVSGGIIGASPQRYVAVACGSYHTVVLNDLGKLSACGNNQYGQLGINVSGTNYAGFLRVQGPPAWTAVACGEYHNAGLSSEGMLWTWGRNSEGQLGHGTSTALVDVPLPVGAATNWSAVACGLAHTVALRRDGTLWAWGRNYGGQLGDGTTVARSSPVQIGSGSQWVSIRCGQNQTFAVRADGTLWACGVNDVGQLGDGTTTSRSTLVQSGSASNWASAGGGGNSALALRTDGTLWSWGSNAWQALGTEAPWVPRFIQPGRSAQSVTFPTPPPLVQGQPFDLTALAAATSGLPVTWTVVGPGVQEGNVFTPTNTGTVTLAAYQHGDDVWEVAPAVMHKVPVLGPEIQVTGGGLAILAGDLVPSVADETVFGVRSITAGSVMRTFTIANPGTKDLVLDSLLITGPHPGDFILTPPASTIVPPGASTTFQILFDPTATGLREATVTLASNDADESPFTFAIEGIGLTAQQNWRQTHFGSTTAAGLAADSADADGDGLANLVEYAFGLSPTSASVGPPPLPRPQLDPNTFTVTFAEPLGITGVVYGASSSPTLQPGTWQGIQDTGTGGNHVFSVPLTGGQSQMFIRLEVTPSP